LDVAQGKRWTFLATRYVFPKLAQERAVNLFIRFAKTNQGLGISDRRTTASTPASDTPPNLADLIRTAFSRREEARRDAPAPAGRIWADFDAVVFRADAAGAVNETARVAIYLYNDKDASHWPALRWGDVIVFERGAKNGGSQVTPEEIESWLGKLGFPHREVR
jgi:hypothetical protein